MGILQALAEMDEGRYVIGLKEVRLKVGPSDKDAALLLIKFLDGYADGEHTNGDALALLTERWMDELSKALDTMPPEDAMQHPSVAAVWDAIFWFRFLIALDEERELQRSQEVA
jgi:hypothetical protein